MKEKKENILLESDLDLKNNYYKAYEKRYKQIHSQNYLWSTTKETPDVIKIIKNEKITHNDKILEIGCGEGRDAIFLLNNNFDVLALDYSNAAIEKCKELSKHKYDNNFRQFDIISDELDEKFDFIYAISVIHMFLYQKHRDKFYSFIYNHLKPNGSALIVSMGDGEKVYESDARKAFENVERTVINNDKLVNVATTSCKIVDWNNFEYEINKNNLIIKRKWISYTIPEFNPAMCAIVYKN